MCEVPCVFVRMSCDSVSLHQSILDLPFCLNSLSWFVFIVILAFVCLASVLYSCPGLSLVSSQLRFTVVDLSSSVWSSAPHSSVVLAAVTYSSTPQYLCSLVCLSHCQILANTIFSVLCCLFLCLFGFCHLVCLQFSFRRHSLVYDFPALPHFWFQFLNKLPEQCPGASGLLPSLGSSSLRYHQIITNEFLHSINIVVTLCDLLRVVKQLPLMDNGLCHNVTGQK